MKHLAKTVLLIFSMTGSIANAETVVDSIATIKQWSAYTLTGHSAWNTEACIASTPGGSDSILEIYAEKAGSAYTEPTVQILFSGTPQAFSAELTTGGLKKWSLTLASPTQDLNLQALMARLNDRENIVAAIKRDNTATVKIRDVKNKVLKTIQFSLSGSSKTIDAEIAKCELKFVEL
jgi:hypothetical protein